MWERVLQRALHERALHPSRGALRLGANSISGSLASLVAPSCPLDQTPEIETTVADYLIA